MDLKYLNTFRTIVEEGSFSRAAERLNYTQSHHHLSDGAAGGGALRPAV